jgi:hypothetical protein
MDKIEDFQNSDINDAIKTAAMKAMEKLKKYYYYTNALVYTISTSMFHFFYVSVNFIYLFFNV